MSASSVMDFQELTETDLKVFFSVTYQLSWATCYLAEIMKDSNGMNVEYR